MTLTRLTDRPDLPPFVRRFTIRYGADDATLLSRFLGDESLAEMAGMAPKRRGEFLAGRYCARHALRALLPGAANVTIESEPDGAPRWPAGIVGSITHVDDIASAVVAFESDASGCGIDIESASRAAMVEGVRDSIVSPEEHARLRRLGAVDARHLLMVVFSAKESVFKCLSRQVGRRFDFLDAEVADLDGTGRFVARIRTELSPLVPAGFELNGRFATDDTHVYTAVLSEPAR